MPVKTSAPNGGAVAVPAPGLGQDAKLRSRATGEQAHVTVISAERGWLDWRLPLLWRYRDLVWLFVLRDFVSIYKQTILGPAWHVVRPLIATFVFTLVFGRMAGLSTDGAPRFLFYLSGYILWTYFATCFDNISRTFIVNANILSKVYFHRLVIPVSLLISNLISLGIQLVLLTIVIAWYLATGSSVQPTWWLLALPFVVLIAGGYALAGGIIVCAITTRYRDLTYFVAFATQFFMYLTPVIYPVSSLSPRYQQLIMMNPLTPLMEALRLGVMGFGTVTVWQVLMSGAGMLVFLALGLTVFSRAERTFADTI